LACGGGEQAGLEAIATTSATRIGLWGTT